MSAEKFVVDHGALESVVRQFDKITKALFGTDVPLGAAYDALLGGAGEFSAKVQPGAAAFLLGWNDAFQLSGDSAQNIANNVGQFNIDAMKTDAPLDPKFVVV